MHTGLAEGQGDSDDIERHPGEDDGYQYKPVEALSNEAEELDDETETTQRAGEQGKHIHRAAQGRSGR